MESTIESLLWLLTVSGLVSVGTEWLKTQKISPKISLAGFSLVLSVLYVAFNQFVPEGLQTTIVGFVGAVIGIAVLIYKVLLKKLLEPNKDE